MTKQLEEVPLLIVQVQIMMFLIPTSNACPFDVIENGEVLLAAFVTGTKRLEWLR